MTSPLTDTAVQLVLDTLVRGLVPLTQQGVAEQIVADVVMLTRVENAHRLAESYPVQGVGYAVKCSCGEIMRMGTIDAAFDDHRKHLTLRITEVAEKIRAGR